MILIRYTILIWLSFFSGCIYIPFDHTTDVTNDSRFWGEYKPGLELELTEEVYLNKSSDVLAPENYYNMYMSTDLPFAWPRSFAEYKNAPDKFPEIKIIQKVQIIKCTKFLFIKTINFSRADVYGVLENGDYKDITVGLTFLSLNANESSENGFWCLRPNPKYLKPIVLK